jgi:cobyrinic acid a,c-diamide synthase
MSQLARFAVGRWHHEMDLRPILWGLVDGLDHLGLRVQTFRSQASCESFDAATSITGLCSRHLDSWLMSSSRIRTLFARSASLSDLSILWGDLNRGGTLPTSRLEDLASTLRMPTIAVLDARRLKNCAFQTPGNVEAVLLDGVKDANEFAALSTNLEAIWNLPVFGALGECPHLRHAVAELRPGEAISRELCRQLGQELLQWTQLPRLVELSNRFAQWKFKKHILTMPSSRQQCRFFQTKNRSRGNSSASEFKSRSFAGEKPIKIAVAYDDAFHCYFPDVLEECELAGAIVEDFSPLRDESLPLDTDLVYISCGHPELFADQLMANTCLQSAMREHHCAGRRIYAEGGGMAALCREIVLADGSRHPMAGIFPAVAHLDAENHAAEQVELRIANRSWLGSIGQTLRTYRNRNWRIEASDKVQVVAGKNAAEPDLIARHNAIGGRLQLDFAAFPLLLKNLLSPFPAALDWAVKN